MPELLAAGYDAVGVDPHAPTGPAYRQIALDELGEDERYDAAVAGRVLHHVRPLDAAVEKLARLAPALLVDEFAWELIDPAAQDWYEAQHRMLAAAGAEPPGPPLLDEWRGRHADLHRQETLLAAFRRRYDERVLEPVPYLHRWLGGPSSEGLEESLVRARAFPAIGWRWSGVRK